MNPTQIKILKEENRRLREALEFYADKSNYYKVMLSFLTPKVLFDDGEIARQALGWEDE